MATHERLTPPPAPLPQEAESELLEELRALRRANEELRKVNARLGRGLLGSSGSGGAAKLAKLQAELEEAREGRSHAEALARESFEREAAMRSRMRRGPVRRLAASAAARLRRGS